MSIVNLYREDNQPYAQIPNDAIRDPKITPNAFRLLAYLMSHKDGYKLTYEQIERQTTLGRHAINQAANLLSSLGWIAVDRPKVAGRFQSKSWTVLNPSSVDCSSADDSTMEQSRTEQSTDLRRLSIKEDYLIKNTKQKALDDFILFWNSYPRKDGKIAAEKAFLKALSITSFETIMKGVTRYRDDPNRSHTFTKQPATWLNQGCWDDEPLPMRVISASDLKAELNKKSQLQLEASRLSAAEALSAAKQARERAEAEPVRMCEHNRVLVICPICNKKSLN